MATLTINLPDAVLPRVVSAFKPKLEEGDAVDLENPTNAEIAAKVKSFMIKMTKRVVENYEKQVDAEQFSFTDLGMS